MHGKVMEIFDTSSYQQKQKCTENSEEPWNKIRDIIKSITNNYDKNYMKIKFNLGHSLPLKQRKNLIK